MLSVEVITLRCVDECVEVMAVARGGNPPYQYAWDDGSSMPARQICLGVDKPGAIHVVATDTAIDGAEFGHAMLLAEAQIQADSLRCGDKGGCSFGGHEPIASGMYQGSIGHCAAGEQVEFPDEQGEPVLAMGLLDLTIDPDQPEQHGTLLFSWIVGGTIVGHAPVTGVLDCNTGELHATYTGAWGFGIDGQSLVDGGPWWGDFTVAQKPGAPAQLEGTFNMRSGYAAGTMPVTSIPIPGLPDAGSIPDPAAAAGGAASGTMTGRCTGGRFRAHRGP
jgi:hypothetical protein